MSPRHTRRLLFPPLLMFRHSLGNLLTLTHQTRVSSIKEVRWLSGRTGGAQEDVEAEYRAARKWLSELKSETIPSNLAQTSFARSSGAGGQHVNKTNSKAILNWPMGSIIPYVPSILHLRLKESRFYVASSDSIQISAQSSRSQHTNKSECYTKLHELLRDLGEKLIPGETSKVQKQKIEMLQRQEEAHRLYIKKKRSSKKQSRSGRGQDY